MLDLSTISLLFVVVALSMLFGFLGGAFRQLSSHRLLQGLHLRVQDIEQRLTREDRRSGGIKRWTKKQEEEEILQQAVETLKNRKPEANTEAPWAMFP